MVVFDFCNQANLHLRMLNVQGHVFITQNARASKQIDARARIDAKRPLHRFAKMKPVMVECWCFTSSGALM
jgi:hypothetical protein